jgi:hypothetical protein
MIELNLLPDIKLEYIKAQRSRRVVISLSVLVMAAAVALLVLLLAANALQKKHISDLSDDISSTSKKLKQQPQIDRILTVQNQLNSLTGMHESKPASSRLFGYLNQVTPDKVAISNLTVDFAEKSMIITGTADALASVNKYVDTLKFTEYEGGEESGNGKAFSNVVLSTFGLASDSSSGKPASYTINLNYDEKIFNIAEDIKLNVPSQVTTRSELERPSDLFQAASQGGAQ